MQVGIMRIDLHLPGIHSLKEKRQIIQRLKATLRNQFNLSVSEIDLQDLHQRAIIGIAGISSSRDVLEGEFRSVLRILDSRREVEVIDQSVEYIP